METYGAPAQHAAEGPAPWWQPVFRGRWPVAVLLDLAPAGRTVLVWPSIEPGEANVLHLGSVHDVTSVRVDGPPLREMVTPRFYAMMRRDDPGAVSGTGVVAIAAEVRPLGTVVLAWLGQTTGIRSVTPYRSLAELERIHGHDGKTTLVNWPDPPVEVADFPLRDGWGHR